MPLPVARFCPFCREPFEDELRCPHHELDLVSWQQLPTPAMDDDQRVGVLDLRMGRGWVVLGVVLTCIAFFFLPFVRLEGALNASPSMATMAIGRAPKLWLVPLGGLACVLVLYRRRSPRSMRGARLALLLMALAPSVTVWLAFRGMVEVASAMTRQLGQATVAQVGWGSWLVWFAALPLLWGGLRLGKSRA